MAGLVASFTVFTLTAAALLSALGLPQDLLRNIAIALLFVVAATLFWPRLGVWLERPLAFMTRRSGRDLGGGFVLGVSLGLVFVPCAGPVLATITVLSAQQRFSLDTVLLTLAYALGAAGPMLLITIGGQRVAQRLRAGGDNLRRAMAVVIALSAVAIIFDAEQRVQTALGGYSTSLQKHIEDTSVAKKRLADLRGGGNAFAAAKKQSNGSRLPVLGRAPEFVGISHWLNTSGERPASLRSPPREGRARRLLDLFVHQLHSHAPAPPLLVLGLSQQRVRDRRCPHARVRLRARALERAGRQQEVEGHVAGRPGQRLQDVERVPERVLAGRVPDRQDRPRSPRPLRRRRVRPDRTGDPGAAGRGGRLGDRRGAAVADSTPTELVTPETYLGYVRIARYAGSPIRENNGCALRLPLGAGPERAVVRRPVAHRRRAGGGGVDARLRLHFRAREVYVVLGGKGRVEVLVDGKATRSIQVGSDRLYTVVSGPRSRDGLLELRFSPGVNAYSFTFG